MALLQPQSGNVALILRHLYPSRYRDEADEKQLADPEPSKSLKYCVPTIILFNINRMSHTVIFGRNIIHIMRIFRRLDGFTHYLNTFHG